MKKFIFIFFFITTMFLFKVQQTKAFVLPVPLPVIDLANPAFTGPTSVVTALDQVNNTILKPIRDVMTIATILSSGEQIKNLILGGMGNNSLLITNPEQYIKNKANVSIKINLGTVASTKGLYSDSILNSIISSTRNSDTKTQLAALSQSNIPSNVQEKMCTEEALNKQVDSEKVEDPSLFAARKKELYDALCKGDPRNDPKLANTLMKVSRQKPNLDTFLAITQGENDYTRSVKPGEIILRDAENKKEATKQELVSGGGLKNETKCTEYAQYDEAGTLYAEEKTNIAPCVNDVITKTSASLKTMWDDTLGAPLKTLQSNLSGASSILGSVFNTISLLGQINGSVNTITSNLGGGGNYSQTTNSAPVSYSNVTYSNLNNNNSQKTTTLITKAELNPITTTLKMQEEVVNDLKTIDQNYLSKINQYNTQLENLNSCFDKLVVDFGTPKEPTFVSFYNESKTTNDSLLKRIAEEYNNLSTTTIYITNTSSAINTAGTLTDAAPIFLNYQNQIDLMGGIPTAKTKVDRNIEYQSYVDFVNGEMQGMDANNLAEFGISGGSPIGNIPRFLKQCATIRLEHTQGISG
jgi:hypothetical protein